MPSRPRRQPAIVGAGRRVEQADAGRLRSVRQNWQTEAWDYWELVGELDFASRFVANQLSKMRLFIGVTPDPRGAPVPWDPDNPELSGLVKPDLAQAAIEELDALSSPFGGQPHLQSETSLNLEVAGECFLVEEEDGFEIRSTEEVEVRGRDEVLIRDRPGETGQRVNLDETYVARLWIRNPRWSELADSHFKRVLDEAETLLMLTRQIRSEAVSRLNAGAWLWPESTKHAKADPTDEDEEDPFVTGLEDALIEPIHMVGSARAAAPFVVWLPDRFFTEGVLPQHVTFDRPSDQYLEARISQRVERMARGLDLPVEIIEGRKNTTFSNASQIDRDIFDDHLEHRMITMVEAYNSAYLWPRLMDRTGASLADLRALKIWFDPSTLFRNPSEKQDAKDAHKAMAISDDALRRRLEFGDEDAPTEEELSRRVAAQRIQVPAELFPTAISDDQRPEPVEAPAEEPAEEPPESASSLVAAVPDRRGRLADRLAEIDRGLLDRVLTDSDMAVRAVLKRIGTKLRTKVQHTDEKSIVADLRPEHVPARLGRALVAQVGEPVDSEIEAMLADELEGRFGRRVEAAQREAQNAIADDFGAIPPDLASKLQSEQEEDRDGALVLLLAALTLTVRDRLFTPTVEPPQVGEFDGTLLVEPAVVRDALARAGGALSTSETAGGVVSVEGGARPAGQVASGERLRLIVAEAFRAVVGGYRWVYGDPGARSVTFEPHRALDGVEFERWDDDALSNFGGTWPAVSHFRPGDHRGCRCSFAPLYTQPVSPN